MRIGIISDIHSNLEALTAVLEYARTKDIDEYVCLGDIVGYGANPNECIDLVRSLTDKVIAGNHDFGVTKMTDISYFNEAAITAIVWTRKILSKMKFEYLKTLPLTYEYQNILFVHSTPSSPEKWYYVLSMDDALREFALFNKPLCFIGHSHQPTVFTINSLNEIGCSINDSIILNDEKRYIVNAGSVGQPRDGNPKSAFLIYDTEERNITFSRIAYDVQKAQKKILLAGLPNFLAERLGIGR